MAKDAGFFRNEKFLFRKLKKWKNTGEIEEKMKEILRRKENRSQALNEIVDEIRACTVVLLGNEHPHFYTSLERIAGKSTMTSEEVWDYRYHLLSLFPKLSGIADDTVKNFQRNNPYDNFGYNFSHESTKLVTPAEFCHSIYFGYTYKSQEIFEKISKLLEYNEKSAKFYLSLDIDAAKALERDTKAEKYLDFLGKNFDNFIKSP